MSFEFISNERLKGKHSFLSPSSYSWTNYTPEIFTKRFKSRAMKERGTELHEAAALLIKNKPDPMFFKYVSDCIEFDMTPEVLLYFSDNCFGTADAISFDLDSLTVRISDLKTGESGSMKQLYLYLAIFVYQYGALYGFGPKDIYAELRLYKPDNIELKIPTAEEISKNINIIIERDNWAEELKTGEGLLCLETVTI